MGIMLLIGGLFFFSGFGITIYGIFTFIRQRRTIAQSKSAVGTVTQLTQKPARRGFIYCPQVQFQTLTGSIIHFQSEFGSNPTSYEVGQLVQLLYNPLRPSEAQINSFLSLWLRTGVCLFVGLSFLFLGFVLSLMAAAVLLS